MAREADDHNSIWAARTSPESLKSSVPRRARAGTLPSRLPSRLAPRLETKTPPLAHLGSLALVSPSGSDIVFDSPPSSRSAVGQKPSGRTASPPLQSIPEPFPTITASSPESSHTTTATATGAASRSRAGSMNSVKPFNPFGNSIWGPGTMSPFSSSPPNSSAGSTSSSTTVGLDDALSPFPKRNNASRMRSYTTMDAPPIFSGIAQTLASSSHNGSLSGSLGPHGMPLNGAQFNGPALGGPALSGPQLSGPQLSGPQLNQPLNGQPLNQLNSTFTPLGALNGPHAGARHRARANTFLGPTLGSIASTPYNLDPEYNLMGEPAASPHFPVGAAAPGPQLGDFSSVPTPALYISNVPPHVNSHTLHSVFGNFGRIETAGVLPARRAAYIVFASTIQAIEAQATANGAELYVGNGPSAVSFAQILSPLLSRAASVSPPRAASPKVPSPEARSEARSEARLLTPGETNLPAPAPAPATAPATATVAGPGDDDTLAASPISVAYVLQSLSASPSEVQSGVAHLKHAAHESFDEPIVPLSEALGSGHGNEERVYNAAVLRDLRRKLEAMPQKEVEELALDMMEELPSLASDYIGNTVVQLVFERSQSDIRDMMLRRLVPVFAATGTHKNGTWAVQKMIDLARGPRHFELIKRAIRPHLVSLLLDQFGNYVVQACLKFGAPYNDFVYSGVASTLQRVAPNRFGARAVRAVLESEHTTLANQRLVATAIVQHLPTLALNANGCLLVSWLLDGFERVDPLVHAKTQNLVASQLVPRYLAQLCMSKIGSGIIVKLASSSRVFDTLVAPLTDEVPPVLIEVLEDPLGQGTATIYRLLTSVFPLNSLERQVTVNKVRMALLRPGAVIPNHKRLLEECGLEMLLPNEDENKNSAVMHAVPVRYH